MGASSALFAAYLAATEPGAVGDRAECRAAVAETDEASLSFPSGHAAIAFAGMTRAAAAVVGAGWLAGRQALVSASSASVPTSSEAEENESRGDADEQTEETRNAERREYRDGEGAFARKKRDVVASLAPRESWYLHSAAACDGGVSVGAFPSSGVARKRGGGSAHEDESQLRQLVESRI